MSTVSEKIKDSLERFLVTRTRRLYVKIAVSVESLNITDELLILEKNGTVGYFSLPNRILVGTTYYDIIFVKCLEDAIAYKLASANEVIILNYD